MQKMQSLIVASVILIVFAVQQGEAIKCYVCNSHSDASCADEVPPVGLVKDCSDIAPSQKPNSKKAYTYCRKIFQIIEFSVNNLPPDSRVIRSCGSQNQTKTNYCYQRAGFGGRQVVCSCDTDECNAAGSLQINHTIMATILFALLLFIKLV